MNPEIKELLITSLKAQYKYVVYRIDNEKKLQDYKASIAYILTSVNNDLEINLISKYTDLNGKNYDSKGTQLALDIYYETLENLTARFVTGHSGDAMLEKL